MTPPHTRTREEQAALTPADALDLLREGNRRFVAGEMLERDLPAQVRASAGGQYPAAAILGCIDSRVPPELVFDQGIGDLFAPRIAGNFVDTDLLGSLEFATAVAGAPLVVVLGHTGCGAIQGACDGVELGHLTAVLGRLAAAVNAVAAERGADAARDRDFVDAVALVNVRRTVDEILGRSAVMRRRVECGELAVVGALHDVETGRVGFLGDAG